MRFNRLASLLLISAAVLEFNTASAQSVDAPTFTAGSRWEYQSYDMWSNKLTSRLVTRALGVSGDYVRMQYETTNVGDKGELMKPSMVEATMRSELNSFVMYRGEKMEKIFYKWPLQTGKKWTYQYKTDLPLTGTATTPQVMTTIVNAEAVDWETVEVPAGKFKAIKIVYKSTWTAENPYASGATTSIQWYSPELGSDVKSTFESIGADGLPQARTMRQLALYKVEGK